MENVRLRIVPTVVFFVLSVFAFGSAMPIPQGDVIAQLLPLLPLAAIGMACATLLALFAHAAVAIAVVPFSVAMAFLFGGDPISAIWTAAYLLPVLALRKLLLARMEATPLLLRLSALCGLVWLPEVYVMLGRAWSVRTPTAMLDRMTVELSTALQAVEIPVGDEMMGYTAAQADEIAGLFVTILPGLILLLSMAMAWLAWRMTRLLFRLHGLGDLFTPAMSTVTMSRIGASVFLCAALLSFFGSGELTITEAISLNLILLLEPPLALIGLDGIIASLRARESINGTTLVCIILMLLTCSMSILLLILAILGVIRTFRRKRATEE